jgi:hypothetical protein
MYSDQSFADALGEEMQGAHVGASTVRKWRLGTSVPRPARIRAIIKITKGEITADSFVQADHEAG